MKLDLQNEIVIYRNNYSYIRYNTRISNPNNCQLVVMCNGITRRINRIEDNILNPRKMTIFSRKKIDCNEYTVYKVKGNFFDCTWGGNVQYLDKRLDDIQEKVFIRASYSFQINSPERVLLLISDEMEEYDKKYINIKINNMIDNTIKNCFVSRLNEIGFIKVQEEITIIIKEVESIITDVILPTFGILLTNLNVIIEESDDHYSMRKNYEWNKINEKEVENYETI